MDDLNAKTGNKKESCLDGNCGFMREMNLWLNFIRPPICVSNMVFQENKWLLWDYMHFTQCTE